MHLFCFGFGYCAGVVAKRLGQRGATITGTATTAGGAQRIAAQGYDAYVFDGGKPGTGIGQALAKATHVLLSIPPDANGEPALKHHESDLAASKTLEWIGYFSTVGVYADSNGGWVDEDAITTPVSERGKRRLLAEKQWIDFGAGTGKPVMIFRLPGIYGPGRNALEDIRAGTARRIVKPGQVFNRIHVDDIASAVEAGIQQQSIRHQEGGSAVYNVTDDEPAPPQDVVAFAAKLIGAPVPPDIDFATADLSPMARSFYGECKRVSNARMKRDLGVTLAYPTYREGLQALLAEGHEK